MEPDDFQRMWAEESARQGSDVSLAERLTAALGMARARAATRRFGLGETLEAAFAVVALLLVGSFLGDHRAEPRFAVPAALLLLGTIAILNVHIRNLIDANHAAYDEPIAVVQKRLETLAIRRYRLTQWILALATLAWTPLLIVAAKGLFGVDVYRFGAAYLAGNVALGLALVPLVLWLLGRIGKRVLDTTALSEARAMLATLAAFERGE